MSELTARQLKERYLKLPKDLRDAIFSVDSAYVIKRTGKKYSLAIDKMGELADETGQVMLGFVHPKDFISNLSRRLEVDRETAAKIAEEINSQIFIKVRDSLKSIHKIGDSSVTVDGSVSAQDTPGKIGVDKTTTSELLNIKKEEVLKEIEKEDVELSSTPILTKSEPQAETATGKVEAKEVSEANTSIPVKSSAQPDISQASKEKIPAILSGISAPDGKDPFEAKIKEEIHRAPPEASTHYSEGDPYREPID